jgi:hypothetical protein
MQVTRRVAEIEAQALQVQPEHRVPGRERAIRQVEQQVGLAGAVVADEHQKALPASRRAEERADELVDSLVPDVRGRRPRWAEALRRADERAQRASGARSVSGARPRTRARAEREIHRVRWGGAAPPRGAPRRDWRGVAATGATSVPRRAARRR